MTSPRLSVLIVARNEEQRLKSCLESARFADETVVVLDRSTDASRDVAARMGARVVEGGWPNEGERRNTAIAQCGGDWILELDADEHVSPELAEEIRRVLPGAEPGHFVVPFHNHFCGVWVKRGWGFYNGVAAKSCLFARGTKHWGDGAVHPPITLRGPKKYLKGHIDHYVDQDMDAMMQRLNWYSSGAARNAVATGRIPGGWGTTRRALSRFLRVYLVKQAWREGWRGLALALFSGLYPIFTYIKIQDITFRERQGKG